MSDAAKGKDGGATPKGGSGRRQRKLRNYLLDKRFQLKYTGIVIGITAVLSLVLGYVLHREIVVSQETILARDLATDTYNIDPGDVEKRQEVSEVIDREFNDALSSKLRVVVTINNAPTGSTANMYEDHFDHEVAQKTSVLIGALAVFLFVLSLFWVYLTHRIAGPVFKLRLLFGKIHGDKLKVAGRLRKGDELQETFVAFNEMIERLRDQRKANAERLGDIADKLKKSPDDAEAAAESLEALRTELVDSLGD